MPISGSRGGLNHKNRNSDQSSLVTLPLNRYNCRFPAIILHRLLSLARRTALFLERIRPRRFSFLHQSTLQLVLDLATHSSTHAQHRYWACVLHHLPYTYTGIISTVLALSFFKNILAPLFNLASSRNIFRFLWGNSKRYVLQLWFIGTNLPYNTICKINIMFHLQPHLVASST